MNLLRKAFQYLWSSLGDYNDNNDFDHPDFPYDLPSNLPADYSYPEDEDPFEEPVCYCYYCQHFEPCSFALSILEAE